MPQGLRVATELAALTGRVPLGARLRALFGSNSLANGLFLLAIVIGFFHGWLKLHYRMTFMTFAFDIPIMMSLGITLLRVGPMTPWFADNKIAKALKNLMALAIVYAILPFGVPLLISLASFRSWVLVPLVFLVGFHVVRSVRQVEVVILLVIALCMVTCLYGLQQSPEEVRAMIAANPEIAARLKGTFFVGSAGEAKLRTFSTFVSAGAFGGTVSFGGFFAFAMATQPQRKMWQRIVFLIACALCAKGVLLSGSRTGLITLGLGAVMVAWGRNKLIAYGVVPAIAGVMLLGGSAIIDPVVAERMASVVNIDHLWGRFSIVLIPSIDLLTTYPMGGGLGRSGQGIPYVLGAMFQAFELRGTDGDLGRIVADFGIMGLVAFGALFWAGVAASIRWIRQFRGSPMLTVAICSGAMFCIAVVNVSTGSPFLAIPNGPLVWFFLGAMCRLASEYDRLQATDPAALQRDPRFVPFGWTLSDDSGPVAPGVPVSQRASVVREVVTSSELPTAARPGRRFLFRRESGIDPKPATPTPPRRRLTFRYGDSKSPRSD